MESTKRRFLARDILKKAALLAADIRAAYREGHNETDYFESFETCYPLVSEYAFFIDEEVKALGIDTEGLSPEQIAKKVYAQTLKKN